MMATDFLKGKAFHFLGEFHQLKTFLHNDKVDPARAIELKRVPGEFSLLNIKTGDKWQIRELTSTHKGKNAAQPCFKIFRPEYGMITILLSECKLKEVASV